MANNPAMVVRVAASVAELKKNLAEGKVQIETTTAAMQRMATGLSGDKLIQKAHDITAAVQSIGGASKLTDAEIGRVNATLDKAIQKYERLGKEAPPAMVALRDATVQTEKPTSLLDSVVGSLGPKILATFSVGAVTAFAKGLIDQGSVVADLAQRYELSTGAVQRFKYAAELGGATLDDVSKAVRFASDALGGGDNKSFNAALEKAGLSAAQLRAMKPEDVFLAITDAVKQIEDPFLRANVAQDLLGKNASVLMPAIRDGFREVGASATQMSGEAVTAMDWIGDKLSTFGPYVKTVVANNITQAWTEYRDLMRLIKNEAPDVMATVGNTAAFERVPPAVQATTRSIDELQKENDALVKKTKESIQTSETHAKKVRDLADAFSGSGVAAKVRDLTTAYQSLTPAQQANAAVNERVVQEIQKLRQAGATLSPVLLQVYQDSQRLLDIRQQEERQLELLSRREEIYHLSLQRTGQNLQVVSAEQQKKLTAARDALFLEDAQRRGLEEYNVVLQHQAYLQSVANAETENAKAPVQGLGDLWKTIGDSITGGFVQILSGARGLKDGMINIFESMTTQILGDVTNRLMKGMLGAITGQQGAFSSAFAGLFGSASSAASASGGAAGVAWSSAAMTAIQAVGWIGLGAWVAAKIWKGFGSSPDMQERVIGRRDEDGDGIYETPVYGRGVEQDEVERRGGGLGPNESHRTDDQFATGTRGRYLDFGAGTRVTLHGRERVVTEAEGRQESTSSARLEREIAALRAEMASTFSGLRRDLTTVLPTLAAAAARDAVLLQGRRR